MSCDPSSRVMRRSGTRTSASAIGWSVCCGRNRRPWLHERFCTPKVFCCRIPTSMTPDQIAKANASLRHQSAPDIVGWAIHQAGGRAIVSTNFRPYEAVILHLCVQVQPDIPVLWVDHGYNRPATYRHAEQLRRQLNLNLKPYLPRMTPAHRDAIQGPIPSTGQEEELKQF